MMPKGLTCWQLRVKVGRKHMVVWEAHIPDHQSWAWTPSPPIIGECRWYRRSRGTRWQGVGDWFRYV